MHIMMTCKLTLDLQRQYLSGKHPLRSLFNKATILMKKLSGSYTKEHKWNADDLPP